MFSAGQDALGCINDEKRLVSVIQGWNKQIHYISTVVDCRGLQRNGCAGGIHTGENLKNVAAASTDTHFLDQIYEVRTAIDE